MSSHFEYKGYLGSAEVDIDGGALVGKLLFIRDTIAYSALSIAQLQAAFQEAVDDYLAACEEDGDEPELPLKGSFNVRVGPERHRQIAVAARRMEIGLNDFVSLALDVALQNNPVVTVVHKHEDLVGWTGSESKDWVVPISGAAESA